MSVDRSTREPEPATSESPETHSELAVPDPTADDDHIRNRIIDALEKTDWCPFGLNVIVRDGIVPAFQAGRFGDGLYGVDLKQTDDRVIVMEKGEVTDQTTPEQLALKRMGGSQVGYINLLRLKNPRQVDGLNAYRWGGGELLLTAGTTRQEALFELSSRDIILFKRHPEAISARNLLQCRVAAAFEVGNRTGLELECGGERLVAEVARQAADELGIREGGEVFAAIKASAFRKLG